MANQMFIYDQMQMRSVVVSEKSVCMGKVSTWIIVCVIRWRKVIIVSRWNIFKTTIIGTCFSKTRFQTIKYTLSFWCSLETYLVSLLCPLLTAQQQKLSFQLLSLVTSAVLLQTDSHTCFCGNKIPQLHSKNKLKQSIVLVSGGVQVLNQVFYKILRELVCIVLAFLDLHLITSSVITFIFLNKYISVAFTGVTDLRTFP